MMFYKHKKLRIVAVILAAILTIVLVTGVAYGHWRNNDYDSNNFNLRQWNDRIPDQYSLDQNQLTKMQDILFDCQDKITPLQRELNRLELEAQSYNDSHDVQPDKVRSYQRQINNVQDEIADIKYRANTNIKDLFNNSQRSYFADIDWCDLNYNGGKIHSHDMSGRCRWNTYQQRDQSYSWYDDCCW